MTEHASRPVPERKRGSGAKMVYDLLRDEILDLVLPPGSPVDEMQLAERFRITKAVGAYKAEHSLPASDPGREERQIARLRALAEAAQLDPEFSEKFLRFIIQEVIRHHEQAQTKA